MTKLFCDWCGVDTTGAKDAGTVYVAKASYGAISPAVDLCGPSQNNCQQAAVNGFAQMINAQITVTPVVTNARAIPAPTTTTTGTTGVAPTV